MDLDVQQRTALDTTTADAVRDLASAVLRADGVEAFGEQSLLSLADPRPDVVHVLARGPQSPAHPRPAGYAQLDRTSGSAELAVHPEARGQGLGAALLSTVRSLARRPDEVRVWAHGDLPPARALAAVAGMQPRRELWRMTRELEPAASGDAPAAPPAPDGVRVRPFVVGQDEQAWLDVNARAFADHPEQGGITLEDVRARQREPWFDAADLLLAERDGRVVGSVWMKVEPGAPDGELYVLAVDPDAQGMGLGRHLTGLVLDHLRRRGLRAAFLYVEAEAAAVRTYTAAGFVRTRVDVQYG